MNTFTSALHDATHQVPGVPAHRDTSEEQRPQRRHGHSPAQGRNRRHQTRRHHQGAPRVLVAWQNWIGRVVGRDDRV